MSWLEVTLLGIIQGLTEFLPVSSSGHLVVGQHLLGLQGEENVLFDVVLHVGTILSVIVYYRRDLLDLIKGIFVPPPAVTGAETEPTPRRFLLYLILATIPTGLIGVIGKKTIEAAFDNLLGVGICFLLTAFILFTTRFTTRRATESLSGWKSLFVGIAQGVAVLPGISRSGATISAALALRINPLLAARYSFLLSIPAVSGAALLKGLEADWSSIDPTAYLTGLLISFLIGFFALKLLIRLVNRGQLHWFGLYCLILGLGSILLGVWA